MVKIPDFHVDGVTTLQDAGFALGIWKKKGSWDPTVFFENGILCYDPETMWTKFQN